jgi:hypothetical protein
MSFKYSYQECLACENCEKHWKERGMLEVQCKELGHTNTYLTTKFFNSCFYFKPKQQKKIMLDITKHKPEELQLRGKGQPVVAIYPQAENYLIIYSMSGDHWPTTVSKNGQHYENMESEYDVILKPKAKKKIAPFYFKGLTSSVLSDRCCTKEQAEKQLGFIAWCEQLAIEVDDE